MRGRILATLLSTVAAACRPTPAVTHQPAPVAITPPTPEPEPAPRIRHDTAPAFHDPLRREKLAATFPELRRRIEAFAAAEELPGLAAGVVIDGELALFVGLGAADLDSGAPVTERTVFRIGSLTKLFTATVLLGLRDSGALALDDPAHRHLAALRGVVYPTADARPITIRDLLLHTSGLPRLGDFDYTVPDDPPTRDTIAGSLDRFALRRDPGSSHEYSNLGYMLLGIVVAGVTHKDHPAAVEQRLLQPLGIRHARWSPAAGPPMATGYARQNGRPVRQDSHWNLGAGAGAGGLYLDIADLARFAAFHLAAWPPRDDPDPGPVRRASLREMARLAHLEGLHVDPSESPLEAGVSGRGLAWSVAQDCRFEHIISHGGGTEGYSAAIHLLPQRGVGVLLLANVRDAKLGRLATELLAGLDDSGALALRRQAPLPAFTAALADLDALLAAWDPARAEAALSPRFMRDDRLSAVERDLAWARARFGRCGAWTATHVSEPDETTFVATCEHGKLGVKLALTSTATPKIATLELFTRAAAAADPRLREAATRATALLSRWRDEQLPATFSANFRQEGLRLFLARSNPEGAACELGDIDLVHADDATFRVRCGAHDLRMTVGHLDDAGRIGGFVIRKAPRGRCGHPPRPAAPKPR